MTDMPLMKTDMNFEDADDFYSSVAKALDATKSDQESFQLMSRLTIILAGQIGSKSALCSAVALAQESPDDMLQMGYDAQ